MTYVRNGRQDWRSHDPSDLPLRAVQTILKLVEFDRIEHKRGVLGCFLNSGSISVGDEFVVTDICLEPIPYAVHERIRWFLKHQNVPAAATDMMHKIGLPHRQPSSYRESFTGGPSRIRPRRWRQPTPRS